MWPLLLLAFLSAMLIFGLTKGYIGIHGAAVYRAENAPLYWAQMILGLIVTVVVAVVVV